MLTPFDDFPIHQTPEPIAQTVSADPNHYDRYFFDGFDQDGRFFIGGAMGHYPNRGVIDAAFSIVIDGVQHSVFASGLMSFDRATTVGPVTIEVLEPLRAIRFTVAANEHGPSCDLVFRARTAAIEEPKQRIVRNSVPIMDYTRLTQWGTWEGTVDVDGTTVDVAPESTFGVRDRSWGVRGVGDQVATNFPGGAPQVFWLWAPLHFEDRCTHLAMFERADGTRWMESALIVPTLAGPDAPTWGDVTEPTEVGDITYDIDWIPGTREMASARLGFRDADGVEQAIEFERLFTFRMRGIGYMHPHWSHGSLHGELEVGGESVRLEDFDPQDPSCIHIQTLCKVRMGDAEGVGILEQLAFGEHGPTGLTGVVDGYRSAG
ncbi:hypothetical protein [Rhabdothermincola salaria]|uniref:hypothetical protein n=1 Tax=Rhabdothermincola salaria TaxID=2903142 RepID=UPI001E384E04|nr:hypothetical protein [Rhabdothermincola salaria]MCD9622334.1 hypothetical protein [Rhabdothermincola salaria]